MAEAAVTFLLETVTEKLKYDGDLIAEAEGELEELQKELVLLKACLKEAAELPEKGPHFKAIEKRTREVIYGVEDTLDTCVTTVGMAETVKSLRQTVKPIYEEARTELDNMKNRGGPVSAAAEEESRTIVKRDPTTNQVSFVGLEDEEDIIINYLMEEGKELDVFSIIGMTGMGKTALVRKIYQSRDIQYEFHNRIWVDVSRNFNKRESFLKILKVFSSEDVSRLSDQELVREVRACLENEMFLIVFDDVWTVDDVNTIKAILPMSNRMGRVVITSRIFEVGDAIDSPNIHPYYLRFLDTVEGWTLLQLVVFKDVGVCPEELEVVGQQIACNCDGMSLTILIIGGILLNMYERPRPMNVIQEEWILVSEKLIYFMHGDKFSHLSKAVELSYDMLHDELRECLIYTGVFPEDQEITAWTLTRLWIAEGFILKKEGQNLEETADEYLNDLISMNLLMVGRTNSMGEPKTLRVDNMIRAFCNHKAAEQNLFKEIQRSDNGFLEPNYPLLDFDSNDLPTQNHRRICSFHSDDLPKFLSEKPSYPSVRSFLCFYKEPLDLETLYITAIPDAFYLLRVLDSKSIKFNQFPTKLIKLIHLRYVTLYVDDLKILPEPMSQLRNLQTLVVDTNSRTLTMKANIWRMKWLRHLKTKVAIVLDQKWEGDAGENLQTLSTLSPESCTESVSNRARNIKELVIRGDLANIFDNNNKFLENLHLLEKLKLVNNDKLGIRIRRTNCFPKNLTRLTLRRTSLQWSDMSTLAKIEMLEVLKLKDNAFTGITWTVSDGFPSLQFLLIADADIVSWEASGDRFPSLTCLSIKNCRRLQKIPHGLAKNLLKLDIDFLGASATNSAWVIQKQKEMDRRNKENVRWRGKFQLSVGLGCKLDQALF